LRGILLCLLAALPFLPACSQPQTDLGERIAGVWLGTCEWGGLGPVESAYITTYHSDGTGVTTSSRALGAGDPEKHGLGTTHHILWEEAGERSIRWRVLHFGHHADGSLRYLSRTHGLMEFDESFDSCSGTFQVEVFEPRDLLDPLDPNDPDAKPLAAPEGNCRARRLRIRIP
jgi:hypothetical protein